MKWLFTLPLLVTLSFSPTFPEPVADTETYYIEEEFTRHDVMWWLNSNDHPQLAIFFVEVPAPNSSKELLEIKLEVIEFVYHYFSVFNGSPKAGTVFTDQVEDYLTVGIRGIEDKRLLYDELYLLPQYVALDPYEHGESSEIFTVRLAAGSIIDGDILDTIEGFNENYITLKIRFDSRYNVLWTPDNLLFLHKLLVFSRFDGKITYIYK